MNILYALYKVLYQLTVWHEVNFVLIVMIQR